MQKEEATRTFEEDAKKAAKKICGCGQCFGPYDCGHSNNVSKNVGRRKLSADTVCPLAKYDVKPDTRTFRERLEAGETELSKEELFAICACCEHVAGVKEINNEYVLDRTEETYRAHCLDCPAHMAYECMLETEAEAAMS